MTPAVGLCAAVEQARFGVWDQQATLLPHAYAEAVQAAGGLAFLLPPDDEAAEHPAAVAETLARRLTPAWKEGVLA